MSPVTVSCSFQETEKPRSLTLHSHCAVFSRQKPHLARGVKIKPFSQQFWGFIHPLQSSVIPGSCWKCALCLQKHTARWHQPPPLQDRESTGGLQWIPQDWLCSWESNSVLKGLGTNKNPLLKYSNLHFWINLSIKVSYLRSIVLFHQHLFLSLLFPPLV